MLLRDLPGWWDDLQADVDLADGELPEGLEAALDKFQGALESKVDDIAAVIRQLHGEAKMLSEEAHRLAQRSMRRADAVDRLKKYLLDTLEKIGQRKVATAHCTVAVCLNSMATVTWDKPGEEPPPGLVKIVKSPDFQAVRDLVKAGEAVPEGFSFTRGKHLRIT